MAAGTVPAARAKDASSAGEVDYGAYQPGTLTDAEKAEGFALFCVATPKTPLLIEVREVRRAGDIAIRKLPCRIEKIDKVAPDVAIVSLKLPANERLQYLAGQYIDLLLKDGRRRSFSIATAPEDDALLELHIRHVPGGHFSRRALQRVQGPRDPAFRRPAGDVLPARGIRQAADLRRRRHRLRANQGASSSMRCITRCSGRWCSTGACAACATSICPICP